MAAVAVLVIRAAAAAQVVEHDALLGIGSADSFGGAGEGLLFFAAVTFQRSEHVFIDVEVGYITRDFERRDGAVSVRGKDIGAAGSRPRLVSIPGCVTPLAVTTASIS